MAMFAISIWPIVSMGLFFALGRGRGLIWSVVTGFLMLPEVWFLDIPGLPPFGKYETIALGLLLGMLATQGRAELPPAADPGSRRILNGFLVVLLVISPIATMLTNPDRFVLGEVVFPTIGLADIRSHVFALLASLAPFFLARRYLHSPAMHRELLKAMVAMGLFYSLLALYELRMSPQLNNIVYGYFPHSWLQHIRSGGWRPLVFLAHGLELGFFLLTAVLAGIGLLRATAGESRAVVFVGTAALFLVLAFSRNLGAFALCLAFAPIALMLAPKTHVRITVIVAILFATYPLVRDVYIVPTLAVAERISAERHQSLEFRFDNEELLIGRAAERPVAGWGTWARWHVHDEQGRMLTVSDGIWIIQLGEWGWLGFFGLFGLLMAPIFLMRRAARHGAPEPVTTILVLMMAVNFIYNIPNATLSPVGWVVAGALAGFVQFAPGRARAPGAANASGTVAVGRSRPGYTRFGPRSGGAEDSVRLSRFDRRPPAGTGRGGVRPSS